MTNAIHLEDYAQFYKALAEPVRLRILALLNGKQSLCVCDLVTVLQLSQSTVSRHLAYLKKQNLVTTWREGNWIHYALQPAHPNFAICSIILQQLQGEPSIQSDQAALALYQQTPRQCSLS